jgi:hypothetical protein
MDLVGGGGVQCAQNGGPGSISGGIPNCNATWYLTNNAAAKWGGITFGNGAIEYFKMGSVFNVNTCQWQTYN